MKLKRIILDRFGPFEKYNLEFPSSDSPFVLLTGKNNAGKSSVIRAIRLLSLALRFADGKATPSTHRIPKKQLQDIEIERLVHNYRSGAASVVGILDNDRTVEVVIDGASGIIECNLPAYTRPSLKHLFGFIPPLGQIAEAEMLIQAKELEENLDTTRAPRFIRNCIYRFNGEQKEILKTIMKESWGIDLYDVQYDPPSGQLYLPYAENSFNSEISLSGQGMQIWLQILSHIIRLNDAEILVLDEPEIYLHPEKQHALVNLLSLMHDGPIVMATHSSEIINETEISDIIYVQKGAASSRTYDASDRAGLDKIGGQIGSDFNFVASQFENVELVLMTENSFDYDVIAALSKSKKLQTKVCHFSIKGLSNWHDCISYKEAYGLLLNKTPKFCLLLDRDYYPDEYLQAIREKLLKSDINTIFTPGKEIENLFINEELLRGLLPHEQFIQLALELDKIYSSLYDESLVNYAQCAYDNSKQYRGQKISSVISDIKPNFSAIWNDKNMRHYLGPGKLIMRKIRSFLMANYKQKLEIQKLAAKLIETDDQDSNILLSDIFA